MFRLSDPKKSEPKTMQSGYSDVVPNDHYRSKDSLVSAIFIIKEPSTTKHAHAVVKSLYAKLLTG